MHRYLLKRVINAGVTLFALVAAVFVISRLLGDPVGLMLPLDATPEQAEAVRASLGLDQPIPVQFVQYLGDFVRGDLGTSVWQGIPALDVVLLRLGPTLQLAAVATLLSVAIAVPLGAIAALRPGSFVNRMTSALSMLAISVPNFWFALLLILVFSVSLRLLPTSGYGGWQYIVLPVAALSLAFVGRLAEITRAAFQDELASPYVTTAMAKGASTARVVFRHVSKNAGMPVITVIADQFLALAGGVGAIELIFGWPGLGWASIDALNRRDFPVLQAAVLVIGVMVVLVNLLVDILYTRLDPRVRFS